MVVNCLENLLSIFLFICNCLYFVTAGFVPNGLLILLMFKSILMLLYKALKN